MSHATVGIIATEEQMNYLADHIADVMSPYDENRRVRPYEEACWCVGRKATNDAHEQAKERGHDWKTYRDSFCRHQDIIENKDNEEYIDAAWAKYCEPLKQLLEQLEKEHPQYNQPQHDCDDCKGTGKVFSTGNPDAKWDWYVVGGRWHGYLTELGIDTLDSNENIVAVDTLLDSAAPVFTPFAFIDHNGEWFQKGRMGWFGMVADKKAQDVWNTEFRALLEKERGNYLVVVDYHI